MRSELIPLPDDETTTPDQARTRLLPKEDARHLPPGSQHYTAYVGPPGEYDFMGATQFRLLCSLGLRESHRLLDLGCGSLRAGRLFIPYLAPGHYYGLEPNRWLVEDALENEVGRDAVRLKQPQFLHSEDFNCSAFGVQFDFILVQSILSHTAPDLAQHALTSIGQALAPQGVAAVTFQIGPADQADCTKTGWVYPDVVPYTPQLVADLVGRAGLVGRSLAWFHPRQVWHLLARDAALLPSDEQCEQLTGQTLRNAPQDRKPPL